jgi:putative ABC transport system ATP-binding protein
METANESRVTQASHTVQDGEFIQVRDVSKSYSRDSFHVLALKNVSLTIKRGDFLALMGPSGSGKTTLLNLIAAIDTPTSGEVLIENINVQQLKDAEVALWRNRNIGYVFQNFYLIPVLSAFENVELPLLLSPLSKAQRKEHVLTALELVGLKDRVDHLPKQLSGGQEQRVSIARAIVSDPQILLADEPTGDLDAASAREIMEILKQLNKELGKTVIIVTHDPEVAAYASLTRHLEKGVLMGK